MRFVVRDVLSKRSSAEIAEVKFLQAIIRDNRGFRNTELVGDYLRCFARARERRSVYAGDAFALQCLCHLVYLFAPSFCQHKAVMRIGAHEGTGIVL